MGLGTSSGAIIRSNGARSPLHIVPQETAPSAALKGDLYVREAEGVLMIYNGSAWVAVGSQST